MDRYTNENIAECLDCLLDQAHAIGDQINYGKRVNQEIEAPLAYQGTNAYHALEIILQLQADLQHLHILYDHRPDA
jgi:hypothetical protein